MWIMGTTDMDEPMLFDLATGISIGRMPTGKIQVISPAGVGMNVCWPPSRDDAADVIETIAKKLEAMPANDYFGIKAPAQNRSGLITH